MSTAASRRVVSLVPSATETLLEWGITPLAVTRFCEHPELRSIGGTKDPHVTEIVGLAPDLVVLCEEENRREDHDAFVAAGLDVFVFTVRTVADVGPELHRLAEVLHVAQGSAPIVGRTPASKIGLRAFVPIWRRPWMTLSAATFGSSMLEALGVGNVFGDEHERYPETTLEEAARRGPDIVVAPSEPYPFTDRHVPELEQVAPVVLVDGQDLFWWGTRTPEALGRLSEQLAELQSS